MTIETLSKWAEEALSYAEESEDPRLCDAFYWAHSHLLDLVDRYRNPPKSIETREGDGDYMREVASINFPPE